MARVYFHTLGCKVNTGDTAAMAQVLGQAGHQVVPDAQGSEVIVVNTCAVTAEAARKSRQSVRGFARRYPQAKVVVTGCASQEDSELYAGIPGVFAVSGTAKRAGVANWVASALAADAQVEVAPLNAPYEDIIGAGGEKTRAFMKIQEGCDAFCSYCIIPHLRGLPRSRAVAGIKAQAQAYVQAGYSEVVLVGINLSRWGIDLPGELTLADALLAAAVPGVRRLRLGSLEPEAITPEFVDRLGDIPGLCPHFHISLQSGSAGVLRAMNRRYTPEQYAQKLDWLRAALPDAAFTTDIIVGFPGESEADWQESRDFAAQCGFSKVHVFPYSPRPGTPAAQLPGRLDKAELKRRADGMADTARALEAAFYTGLVGSVQPVLLEQECAGRTGYMQGHAPNNALVAVRAMPYARGEIRRVKILQAHADYAVGEEI